MYRERFTDRIKHIDITRDVMGGDLNKGKLIARPPTKKKPTKGKTLVKKRS